MVNELSLRLFVEWGIITESEYLRLEHPNPQYTRQELEAMNWSPAEFGF